MFGLSKRLARETSKKVFKIELKTSSWRGDGGKLRKSSRNSVQSEKRLSIVKLRHFLTAMAGTCKSTRRWAQLAACTTFATRSGAAIPIISSYWTATCAPISPWSKCCSSTSSALRPPWWRWWPPRPLASRASSTAASLRIRFDYFLRSKLFHLFHFNVVFVALILLNFHSGRAILPWSRHPCKPVCYLKETNTLEHYVEKPSTFVSTLVNCGVYIFSPQVFQLMTDVFQQKQIDYFK